jgi:cell division protein FtsQ
VKEALEIYQLLSIYLNEIRGLIRIGERRWDIIFKNNKRIKLSEKYPKRSLRKFLSSDKSYLISSNDFVIIDLRFTNKIILRKLIKDITKP